MSIFSSQIPRLVRNDWGSDAQALAEEIIAIFGSKEPIVIDSGLQVSNPNGNSPLTLVTNNTVDNTEVPPISIVIGGIQVPNVPKPTSPPATGGGGGNALAGVVVSLSSGVTYNCSVYSGPTTGAAAGVVPVEMKNITADDSIPAGTWVMVLRLIAAATKANPSPKPQYVGFPAAFLGP